MSLSWLTHRRIWIISHYVFAFSMFSTLLVSSTAGTIIISGCAGISWAVANWIPYAFLGAWLSENRKGNGKGLAPAGAIFGLHNLAICMPQVIVSIGSNLLWRLDGDTLTDPESIAWVLRIGGGAALAAAWFTRNIEDPVEIAKCISEEMDRLNNEESALPGSSCNV
jgi:solute carrier family 45 protein 1/2/4